MEEITEERVIVGDRVYPKIGSQFVEVKEDGSINCDNDEEIFSYY